MDDFIKFMTDLEKVFADEQASAANKQAAKLFSSYQLAPETTKLLERYAKGGDQAAIAGIKTMLDQVVAWRRIIELRYSESPSWLAEWATRCEGVIYVLQQRRIKLPESVSSN